MKFYSLKIWTVNLSLFLLFGVLLYKCAAIWHLNAMPTFTHFAEKGQTVRENPIDTGRHFLSFRKVRKKQAYDIISRKNLFNPERTAFKQASMAADVAAVAPTDIKNQIHLCGVLIYGDQRKALIQSPAGAKGRNAQRWVAKGENVSGYVIDDINADKIVVKKGINRYPLYLYAHNKAKSKSDDPQQTAVDKTKTVMKNKPAHFDEDEAYMELKEKEEFFITPGGKRYKIISSPSGKRRVEL